MPSAPHFLPAASARMGWASGIQAPVGGGLGVFLSVDFGWIALWEAWSGFVCSDVERMRRARRILIGWFG